MSDASQDSAQKSQPAGGHRDKLLFWACFIALIATAFGFVIRGQVMNAWAVDFGLTETQKGEIFGVGLWPFAISIVLFSLVIDKIGYGKAMIFAFLCHATSAVVTIFATGYWSLYIGTFIVALGNGTVEAVVNPVVATMFPREKTKWLNILHAGWPGGLVLGGILGIGMGGVDWRYKVALIFIPTLAYGLLMLGRKFPIQERVAAGISYKDMLKEIGGVGALVVLLLIFGEVGRVFGWDWKISVGIAAVIAVGFGVYVGSLGRPMFIFMLLIMIPLATTELGTDSWITPLMETPMKAMDLDPGWVLVYTSAIMMILRFFAGPIVHKLSPLGLLAASSVIAALGLVFLSNAVGVAILAAATIYGLGKSFFWPTMLGVAAERFPKGGALTLNAVGGVGMLGVGVVGNAFLGYIQDTRIASTLQEDNKPLYENVIEEDPKQSVFGDYNALDAKEVARIKKPVELYERRQAVAKNLGEDDDLAKALKEDQQYQLLVRTTYNDLIRKEGDLSIKSYEDMLAALKEGEKNDEGEVVTEIIIDQSQYESLKPKSQEIQDVTSTVQKGALTTVAIFPVIMFVCYLALILYFRTQGGYEAEVLTGHEADDEEYTGGVPGPADH